MPKKVSVPGCSRRPQRPVGLGTVTSGNQIKFSAASSFIVGLVMVKARTVGQAQVPVDASYFIPSPVCAWAPFSWILYHCIQRGDGTASLSILEWLGTRGDLQESAKWPLPSHREALWAQKQPCPAFQVFGVCPEGSSLCVTSS